MQSKKQKTTLFKLKFKHEVIQRKNRVDPNNSEDWYSLALGWAIAKSMPPEEAHNFAKLIRYYSELK